MFLCLKGWMFSLRVAHRLRIFPLISQSYFSPPLMTSCCSLMKRTVWSKLTTISNTLQKSSWTWLYFCSLKPARFWERATIMLSLGIFLLLLLLSLSLSLSLSISSLFSPSTFVFFPLSLTRFNNWFPGLWKNHCFPSVSVEMATRFSGVFICILSKSCNSQNMLFKQFVPSILTRVLSFRLWSASSSADWNRQVRRSENKY